MALLVQKFSGGIFLSEFVSGYFKTLKKALVAGPLKKITFFGASLIDWAGKL